MSSSRKIKMIIAGGITCVLAAACAVVFAGEGRSEAQDSVQQSIAEKILRFHVIANSDSNDDQELKLKVRDEVLECLSPYFEGCTDRVDCEKVVSEHMEEIKARAEAVLLREGCASEVDVSLTERYFPVKKYGEYTFPEGKYEALCIEIGKAEGKNWWCVLYPRLCFMDSLYAVVPDDSEEELRTILTAEEYEAVMRSSDTKIVVKSRLMEWFGNLL